MATPWANLNGKPTYTVSPVNGTFPNNGADYGPSTAGTVTVGINEAILAVAAAGGGTVYLLPGTFVIAGPILVNGANHVNILLDPGAIIQISAAPGWSVTVGANPRYPHILVVNSSNLRISGGQFVAGIGSQNSELGGILVAGNVNHAEFDHLNMSGMTGFGIHACAAYSAVTGYPSGTPATSSAPYAYIFEHDNNFDSMGAHTSGGDGGGVRWGNDQSSGGGNVHHIWTGFRDTITNVQMFGIDIANGGMVSTMSDIVVGDAYISVPPYDGTVGTIGMNFETANSSTVKEMVVRFEVIAPHVTGGYKAFIIGGNWYDGTIHGGRYEFAYLNGLELGAGGVTTARITVVSPICRNNNQGKATTGQTRFGLGIGIVSGSVPSGQTGTLSDIEVLGGDYSDDQGASATQDYGIGIYCSKPTGATAVLKNVFVKGGKCSGNKTGSVSFPSTPTLIGTISNVLVMGASGYNPVGKLGSGGKPLDNTNFFIGPTGTANTPSASAQKYTVLGPPQYVDWSGGAGVTMTVYDPSGTNTVATVTASASGVLVWPGYLVAFAYTTAPTVTSYGA